jgi:hypothetical protein
MHRSVIARKELMESVNGTNDRHKASPGDGDAGDSRKWDRKTL